MSEHHKINYLEIPTTDLPRVKEFFSAVFAWRFTAYGPEYCSIDNASFDGGFYLSDTVATVQKSSVLVVLYSEDLSATSQKIMEHGGSIIKPVFSFPGGHRFHFSDPNGGEYAVWKKA